MYAKYLYNMLCETFLKCLEKYMLKNKDWRYMFAGKCTHASSDLKFSNSFEKLFHRSSSFQTSGAQINYKPHSTVYVYRLPGFLTIRPNWVTPPPHQQEKGVGGPNSDDGTDTLVI
jgi:hypothetical protein